MRRLSGGHTGICVDRFLGYVFVPNPIFFNVGYSRQLHEQIHFIPFLSGLHSWLLLLIQQWIDTLRSYQKLMLMDDDFLG